MRRKEILWLLRECIFWLLQFCGMWFDFFFDFFDGADGYLFFFLWFRHVPYLKLISESFCPSVETWKHWVVINGYDCVGLQYTRSSEFSRPAVRRKLVVDARICCVGCSLSVFMKWAHFPYEYMQLNMMLTHIFVILDEPCFCWRAHMRTHPFYWTRS